MNATDTPASLTSTCPSWCVDHRFECSSDVGECHGLRHRHDGDDGHLALELNVQRYDDPLESRVCVVVMPEAGAEQIEFIPLPALRALLAGLRDYRPQMLAALDDVAAELGITA